ncbi:MAG TPA: carboxypeptidase regulatory-like domain-containing protein [Vicinamibacterales bacterium]
MRVRVLACALTALLLSAAAAAAQQGTTEIKGRVIDNTNAAVPGASIVVRNQETGMFRETISAADGTYFVGGIVPGLYEVIAELQGFKKLGLKDVRLEIGKTTTLDLQLVVGGLEEVVSVSAESPLVDVTTKEVGGNITGRELVDLPSINRNFIGFIGLLPGIVPSISTESFGSDSISVNGADPRNNNYMLDGGNNNDDVIGQRAGTQARTAIESVQEFQVITNQFDAQFGRTTGAIINAVTKSGTNAFHGSGFVFAQDAGWTAKDYFAKERRLPKPDTKRREFGGTLGGPIIKNKAHFFGSLERVMIDRGAALVFTSRPDLNWSPTTQDRVWNTLARVDHQLNANNTWGVRYLRELSPQRNQAIGQVTPRAIREENDKDQTVVTTLSSVFGSNKFNSIRVGWTQEDVAFANPCFNGNGRDQAACEPTLNFQTFTDQQSPTAQARVNDAYQVESTFSWFMPNKHGDHDVKFGAQYEYVEADNFAQDNLNGTFAFGQNDQPFDRNNPRTYPDRLTIRVPGQGRVFEKAHYVSLFAQDKWKLTNRVTATLGVRWDLEAIPVPERDNPDFASENDYPVDKNNVQPRAGLSIALDEQGRSVVRAGYGRFYDKTHFEIIGGFFNNGVFSDSFTVNFPTTAADPGPRNGNLPTDEFLVNGPVLNRALLQQRYPSGSRLRNAGNVTLDNPDRTIPHSDQVSVGYEHQVGATISASADYVHVFGRGLFMTFDKNKGVRATTAATATIVRPDPAFQQVNTFINVGESEYDAMLLQVEKRLSRGVSARVSYTMSSARGNTTTNGSGAINFQQGSVLNLDLNEGPTDFDRRHNLVISGRALVPYTKGMTFSWVARALSGLPFTLTNNTIDPDRNGTLFDPIASGTYTGAGQIAADNYSVSDYDGRRNGARGPGFFQFDTRFGWRINMGSGRTLDLSADVFNITNRANFANPAGNQGAPQTFLILSALRDGAAPTTLQLGVRYGF